MFGLSSSEIDLIISVFGSRAMGNYKRGSDIDLALKGDLSYETTLQVSVDLNEYLPLPYKFDIVDYGTITHPPLVEEIDLHGQQIYSRAAT